MAHSEDSDGPIAILFIIACMLFGGLLRELYKKTKFPYTPMLLILGLLLGYYRKSLGVLGHSTDILEKLNPHMILFIFIPVLIFESAFNCNWFVFRRSIVNILILAVPGVLWGTVLLALCFKWVLMYGQQDLTWPEAFTLGAMLSATDPVAVMALMKELGASVRFNTLIEGESLLNDGTAMVFFMMFLGMVKGQNTTVGEVIVTFLRTSIGGPLLGIAVGMISSSWIKRIINDQTLLTNITFVSCYFVFYLAEFTWLHVSGILSLVSLGLYMSAVGKTKIYSQSEHSLHAVWSYIQYVCETIIFVLTGVIIGVEILERSTIDWTDWVKLFVFWFLMIFSRFIMMATFYPILKRYGYGVHKKQFIVMVYGGLRGAIGLSLGLIIMVDDSLRQRFRELTIFFMSGMAVMTIVINGFTCKKVVDYIQMIVVPPIKEKLLKICMRKVTDQAREKLEDLKVERFLQLAEWKKIQPLAGWLETGSATKKRNSFQLSNRVSLLEGVNREEINSEIRFRLLRYIKSKFWEKYQDGECSEEAVVVLSGSIDFLLDDTSAKIKFWDLLVKNFTFYDIKYWMKIKDWIIVGNFAQKVIVNRVFFVYDVCSTLVMSCSEAVSLFRLSYPVRKEYIATIVQEIEENIYLAESYLHQMQHTYQSLIMTIHTQKAAANLLIAKKKALYEMREKGFVDQSQFEHIRKELDRQYVSIRNDTNYRWEKLTYQEIILECPMFSSLSKEQLRNLRVSSVQKQYRAGQVVQAKDSPLNHAHIIIEGIVQEEYSEYKTMRSIGAMISLHSVITSQTSLCLVKAHTPCTVLTVQLNKFKQLVVTNKTLEAKVYKAAFSDAIKNDRNNPMNLYPEYKLKLLANHAAFVHMETKQSLSLPYGGYMFNGEVRQTLGRNSNRFSVNTIEMEVDIFRWKNFIIPGVVITALKDSTVLIFKEKYYEEDEGENVIAQHI